MRPSASRSPLAAPERSGAAVLAGGGVVGGAAGGVGGAGGVVGGVGVVGDPPAAMVRASSSDPPRKDSMVARLAVMTQLLGIPSASHRVRAWRRRSKTIVRAMSPGGMGKVGVGSVVLIRFDRIGGGCAAPMT